MRMQTVFIPFFVALGLIVSLTLGCHNAPNYVFEEKFNESQEIMFKLIFPNKMSRVENISPDEIQQLLSEYKEIAFYFKENQNRTVPFLADKLASAPIDSLESGVCALQLLFEIDTKDSTEVIKKAINHSNTSLSDLAAQMINNNQDVLGGFR